MSSAVADTAQEDTARSVVNSTLMKSHDMSVNVYPYAFYNPEVELAFGAGGIITFYTSGDQAQRPSKNGLSGYYSSSKQYKIGFAPQVYFLGNRFFASAKFFLAGKTYFTPDIDNPEIDAKLWGIRTELRVPALFTFKEIRKVGSIFDYQHVEVKNDEQDTGENPPHTLGLGLAWIWDTREHLFYPSGGGLYRAQAVYFFRPYGSDFDFNRYEVDLWQYLGIDLGKNRSSRFNCMPTSPAEPLPFTGYRLSVVQELCAGTNQANSVTGIIWPGR